MTPHCRKWYKLVLRTHLPTLSVRQSSNQSRQSRLLVRFGSGLVKASVLLSTAHWFGSIIFTSRFV